MKRLLSKLILASVGSLALLLTLALPGCGGDDNERDFLRDAPRGVPAEPEKVSARRERLRSQSPTEKKLEERNKEVAEKLEEKNKALAEKKAKGGS